MVCISKNNSTAQLLNLLGGQALDRSLRSDWHEDRRIETSMWEGQSSSTSLAPLAMQLHRHEKKFQVRKASGWLSFSVPETMLG